MRDKRTPKDVCGEAIEYPASNGFSRPDATLRRERNRYERSFASLIELPSSAMDGREFALFPLPVFIAIILTQSLCQM